jgi:hypothetical protein
MTKHMRIALILTLSVAIPVAYSPLAFAKDRSNSNSDDSKTNDDQNDQGQKKPKYRSIQKVQQSLQSSQNNQSNQGSQSNQGRFGNSQQSKNSQSWQNFQQQSPWRDFRKQSDQQQGSQKSNWQNNWAQQSRRDNKEIHNYVVKFGGSEPFSVQWYKDHPKAWRYVHHDHDNSWKVATTAGLFGFLGWDHRYYPRGPVVIYRPVSYNTLFVPPPGVIIDISRGEWMPLGTYSLMLGPTDYSTRMLNLNVDRFGHIRGSYYDMVSGSSYNVAGIIDPRTQYAQWSLESNRQLTFFTPISEMTQPQGAVTVQLPSGQQQQWQLVRMDGP